MPMKPEELIAEEDARTRKSFYEANFDDHGRLVAFSKYLDGVRIWSDAYEYEGTRLARRKLERASGDVTVQEFSRGDTRSLPTPR